jgi:hypothetical protein
VKKKQRCRKVPKTPLYPQFPQAFPHKNRLRGMRKDGFSTFAVSVKHGIYAPVKAEKPAPNSSRNCKSLTLRTVLQPVVADLFRACKAELLAQPPPRTVSSGQKNRKEKQYDFGDSKQADGAS